MSPLRMIAIGLVAAALPASMAMAQYKNPPGGLPGVSMPGGAMPIPSMPSPAPSITVPPMAPELRPPAMVVPPPPPAPARSQDAGGMQECDCYRTVDGKRVFTGKNVACCPK